MLVQRTMSVRWVCEACVRLVSCFCSVNDPGPTERDYVTRVVPGDVGHRRRGTRARVIGCEPIVCPNADSLLGADSQQLE